MMASGYLSSGSCGLLAQLPAYVRRVCDRELDDRRWCAATRIPGFRMRRPLEEGFSQRKPEKGYVAREEEVPFGGVPTGSNRE